MTVSIYTGDCRERLRELPAASAQCVVTSPPYYRLRDYGHDGQIGLEQTPADYVAELVAVFREVRRVLRDDGTVWLNLGDSYARTGGTDRKVSQTAQVRSTRNTLNQIGDRTSRAEEIGLKPKDLIGIPWRVAFALQDDGWYLRQDIIWHKPNPMPESVRDRCTKAHEYVFLLTKRSRYFYDADAIAGRATDMRGTVRFSSRRAVGGMRIEASGNEAKASQEQDARKPTRNRRSVWRIATQPFSGAHFAVMPPALVERCIKAGTSEGDTVLDPFGGAGTVGLVADRLKRDAVLIELNPEYAEMARQRIVGDAPMFARVAMVRGVG